MRAVRSTVGFLVVTVLMVVMPGCGSSSSGTSSSSSSSSAQSDQQLIMTAVQGYFGSSGSVGCNFLSPANISANYGSLANCQKQFAGSEAEQITGTQQIQISGMTATDSGFVAGSDPLKLMLVKQNGKWLIDHIDNLNVDSIERTISSYASAVGGNVCNYFSPQYLNSQYNGSLTTCQKGNANATSLSIVGNQNVNENGRTGTDSFQLSNNKKFKATLSKQPGGQWLIDNLQVTK